MIKTSNWPIANLHKEIDKVILEIENYTLDKIFERINTFESLKLTLLNTIDKEKSRVRLSKYDVDPKDDNIFWINLEKKINDSNSITTSQLKEIYKIIVKRYLKEINCNFNPKITDLTIFLGAHVLSRVLNKVQFTNFINYRKGVLKRVRFVGHENLLNKLSKIGTFVFVPTHYSHFDNLYAGIVSLKLNIPTPLYAAGLNLYNSKFFSFFMNNVGTYTLDRRKKNLIYLETLKSYSQYSIKYGCNTTFYPGGGRVRSGSVENALKLGLLSTVWEAQKLAYKEQGAKAKKIFIVPLSLSAECVLEAPKLIDEYLKNYVKIEKDKESLLSKLKKFYKIIVNSTYSAIGIGHPMDAYGNFVDEDGLSLDINGNKIDIFNDDFMFNKALYNEENNFVKKLESRIIKEYKRCNYIFLGHILAFNMYHLLKSKYSHLDKKEFWSLDSSMTEIQYSLYKSELLRLKKVILSKQDMFFIDPDIHKIEDKIIVLDAAKRLGAYHSQAPLLFNKSGNIYSENIRTLFYYSNKLSGYGIDN